jgi:hypothetical protein
VTMWMIANKLINTAVNLKVITKFMGHHIVYVAEIDKKFSSKGQSEM